MPEWGSLPIPKKCRSRRACDHGAHLRRAHERHELRRLRAACFARESFVGGPLAFGRVVRTGDIVTLDVPARTLNMEVSEAELAARRCRALPKPEPRYERGYAGCSRGTSSRRISAATSTS